MKGQLIISDELINLFKLIKEDEYTIDDYNIKIDWQNKKLNYEKY